MLVRLQAIQNQWRRAQWLRLKAATDPPSVSSHARQATVGSNAGTLA